MKTICPSCGRLVCESHFSCKAGSRGGLAGGQSKVRGDSEYYRHIAARRKNPGRKKSKHALCQHRKKTRVHQKMEGCPPKRNSREGSRILRVEAPTQGQNTCFRRPQEIEEGREE